MCEPNPWLRKQKECLNDVRFTMGGVGGYSPEIKVLNQVKKFTDWLLDFKVGLVF